MINLTAADFPSWIKYEEADDADEMSPTANKDAYDYYKQKYGQDYQYYPIESCAHWWGSPTAGYTHDGIVNDLKKDNAKGVDFVVSANRITNFKRLHIVSYTTGARSMYQWTSENDPALTEDGYKTLGFLHYAVEKKNPRLQGEAIRRHLEFMPTECSPIDVAKVRDYANKFKTGALDPETGKPPVVVDPGTPDPDPETPSNPPEEQPPVPPSDAAVSATKFLARITSQIAAAAIIVNGLAAIAKENVGLTFDGTFTGWATLLVAGILVFWAQFGYKIGSKFKWPF